MSPLVILIIVGVGGLFVGSLVVYLLASKTSFGKVRRAEDEAKRIVDDAAKEAEIKKKEAQLEAKDEFYKSKVAFERELQAKKAEFQKVEKKLVEREINLDRKVDILDKKEKEFVNKDKALQHREKGISIREKELEQLIIDQNKQLERVAQMSSEEAKRVLMDNLIGQAKMEAAAIVKEIKEKAEHQAEKEAREIIIQAIYRCAAEHTVESTVSVVPLPNDEMKGRIIGREGRNIRTFETLTGVDVIVDDTPEAVILSAYDPVRREVARMALEKLVVDGRIHPTRIEEVVEKANKEMSIMVREAGEQATFELGLHGLHDDVINLMGKLRYRTSYGQNVLGHVKEVATLCALMAAELGLDAEMAKRAGFLHDIGKAIDRETEGTHTQIGMAFLRKYNEHEYVINAVGSHHNDIPHISPYDILVQAADAISGARPGARREPLEGYIKRLEKLEEIAESFKGVAKSYAIQAGREVRVIVENNEIDDIGSTVLASDIARKIESELEYPGQIKVTVIRESRSVDYAK
jgi:ribonuclease Y